MNNQIAGLDDTQKSSYGGSNTSQQKTMPQSYQQQPRTMNTNNYGPSAGSYSRNRNNYKRTASPYPVVRTNYPQKTSPNVNNYNDRLNAQPNDVAEYTARKEPLASLLKNISSLFGMSSIVSKQIKGQHTGTLRFSSLNEALAKLSDQFDIIWYKGSGNIIQYYKSDELQSATLKSRSLNASALIATLKTLGAYDPHYRITGAAYDGRNIINVNVPPGYLEKIREIISSFDDDKEASAESVIKVYKLKYSSAYDRTYQADGETKKISGIATILNNIFTQDFDPNTAYSANGQQKAKPPAGIMLGKQAAEENANSEANKGPSPNKNATNYSAFADIKTNSVIVHTAKASIPMITQLINSLDVPEQQIEIELNIVDVNSNKIDELGIDWSGSYSSKNFNLNFNASGPETLVSTTKINSAIRALTSEGKADVVARPSVIVKNNIEAVLENTETFYVKLTGVETVDLVPVNYGTKVIVQPRIMQTNNEELIYVTVNVQDGSSTTSEDESGTLELPKVKNMYISTQASVRGGESLLLGGYTKDRLESSVTKVPGISRIPILKHLFSSSTDTAAHQVRLFIITPTIQSNMLIADDPLYPNLPKDVDKKIERLKNLSNMNPNITKTAEVNFMVGCGTASQIRQMRQDLLMKGARASIKNFNNQVCLYVNQ